MKPKTACTLTVFWLVLAGTLTAGSIDEAVLRHFASENVELVFAIPTSAPAERLNEISRLTSTEASLHIVLSEFEPGSREQEIVWKQIRKQRKLTERLLAEWARIESKRGDSGVLCRYYIRRDSGFQTGFAIIRNGGIEEEFFVEKASGEMFKKGGEPGATDNPGDAQ